MSEKSDLTYNPYIVGNPIRGREMFFGREDDFRFLAARLTADTNNRLIVFSGDRRSGKTSILFQILDGRLGEKYLPVLFDLQMQAGITGDRELFCLIADSVYEAAGLSAVADRNDSTSRIIDKMFSAVEIAQPGRTLLLLVDEYELIEMKINDNSITANMIHLLAAMLESRHRISYIFAGSSNIRTRGECWKPLLTKSHHRHISYLSKSDSARLITEPVKDVVRVTEDIITEIFRLAAGHPFFTQVVCQNLIDLLIEEKRTDPSVEDMNRVVRYIIDNPLPHMIYSWRSQTDEVKIHLAGIASRTQNGTSWINTRKTAYYLQKHLPHHSVSLEQTHSALEKAYHLDILEKAGSKYRFKMDLYRQWIAREHSIWSIPNEVPTSVGEKKSRSPLLRISKTAIIAVSVTLVLIVAVLLFATPIRGKTLLTTYAFQSDNIDPDYGWIAGGFSRAIAVHLSESNGSETIQFASESFSEKRRNAARYTLSGEVSMESNLITLAIRLSRRNRDTMMAKTFRVRIDQLTEALQQIIDILESSLDIEYSTKGQLLLGQLEDLGSRAIEGYLGGLHFLGIEKSGPEHTLLLQRLGIGTCPLGIIFVTDRHNWGDIYEIEPDTGNASEILNGIEKSMATPVYSYLPTSADNSDRSATMPRVLISPDRDHWIIEYFVRSSKGEMHLIDLGETGKSGSNIGVAYKNPVWSSKGDFIAAERISGGIAIYGQSENQTTGFSQWSVANDKGTSPDWGFSNELAFSFQETIYIRPKDGKLRQIAHGTHPRFSLGGKQLAFLSGEDPRSMRVIDIKTANEFTLLEHHGDIRSLSWSPNGSRLLAEFDFSGNTEICIVEYPSGDMTNISRHEAEDVHPVWSPDGTRIVFQSLRDGNWELYILESDGTGLRNLTNNPAADVHPEWR